MNGEIYFDMTKDQYPISGSSKYLLKRWTKHSIYTKTGPYVRGVYQRSGSYQYSNHSLGTSSCYYTNYPYPSGGTYYTQSNNINENLYSSSSVYLYDYIVVSDKWFYDLVYTASFSSSVPMNKGGIYPRGCLWVHSPNTFKTSPNSITNNYVLTSSRTFGPPVFGFYFYDTYLQVDDGVYFEIVNGYPKNHFIHKRDFFSLNKYITYGYPGYYYRNRQSVDTTIGEDGLEDKSLPVQSVEVGNLNLIQTDNVINH